MPLFCFKRKENTIMFRRIRLVFLISNTLLAKVKLGISNKQLADILGVSVDSVERWFKRTQLPSELNEYKLNWFVYLVLDKLVTFKELMEKYDIAHMTLDSNASGKGYHSEPWNDNVCDDCSEDDLLNDDENCFNDPHDDFFDHLYDENEALTEPVITNINDALAMQKDSLLENSTDVESLFNESFNMWSCSYQENLRRVEFLKKACEVYTDTVNEALLYTPHSLRERYKNVHDYKSFYEFLDKYRRVALLDERYDITKGNVKIRFSKYLDPEHKVACTNSVMRLIVFRNVIILRCADQSACLLEDDGEFVIKASGSSKSDNFNFLIRKGNEYFSLSFEIGE